MWVELGEALELPSHCTYTRSLSKIFLKAGSKGTGDVWVMRRFLLRVILCHVAVVFGGKSDCIHRGATSSRPPRNIILHVAENATSPIPMHLERA